MTEASTAVVEAEPVIPRKRRIKRSTRIALIIIGVVAVLAVGIVSVTMWLESRKWVSTDNAQIDGDSLSVNAPATGTVIGWQVTEGTKMVKGQSLGRIQIQGAFAQPQMAIPAPANGTVAVNNGRNGVFVATGAQLAIAYDLSAVYVTARVEETDIAGVTMGAQVEITVDAYSDTPLNGTVKEIQGGTAGQFSLFPQDNTTGNFQKVTQVVPVKISVADQKGLHLVPGMNVEVKIRRP
ncbi:efflux RND transporter periplasmic adaptor subunit [Nonomuraea typhae]|uniref:efflux RND transporter periplasmic adaptor subunit n=1 Tax=Nonomuraea typhae TaxID=2603600 RepID=UPI001CA5949C|nr:efflux RND transporter periplasmic adaptor subunit [Nonomuraea typhae]